MQTNQSPKALSLLLLLLISSGSFAAVIPPLSPSLPSSPLPSDAVALLSFKSKADLDNRLFFSLQERFDYCLWQGVKCAQGRVVRLALPSFRLRGTLTFDSLPRLTQLRVINIRNNSLSGPIPDLSPLLNLKTLFLSANAFSGSFPPSLLFLHRLQFIDLSRNTLTGPIPPQLDRLDRIVTIRLESNRLSGTIPPLNQSTLLTFNVSANNLTGAVPVTTALSRFKPSSFSQNPNLCGKLVGRECGAGPHPFFGSSPPLPPGVPFHQSVQSQGVLLSPPAAERGWRRTPTIIGFCIAGSIVILSLLIFLTFVKRERIRRVGKKEMAASDTETNGELEMEEAPMTEVMNKVEEKGEEVSRVPLRGRRSGSLVFSEGEMEAFSLDQLMRASAEMLGRGSIGATYKAVMDNRLIVSVKRFDAGKTAATSEEAFERHMEVLGGLRHPNLVPMRAYFQASEERLIVYDFQPNGSLLSLIHGSRSTRARPLHWTSCLKIAEDVAQGLAYIHQASKLVHGNLKASNVLLGPDFEACLTDYCLTVLADSSSADDDPDSVRYKAPETRKSIRQATPRSDVYAFGILLLEILTGKPPSQHPFLTPTDMPDWVQAMRGDEGGEDNYLGLLIEVASICSLSSTEQRPTMRRVLKMIQEIKETLMAQENKTSFGFP